MVWEGSGTHRGVTGPMKFKKSGYFFQKSVLRNFGAHGCHPSTLIDLANTALASEGPVGPLCVTAEVYRTHSVVTGPMNFKKSGRFFFFGKSCSRIFGAPGCIPVTLFDLVNTGYYSRDSAETRCIFSEGYRTHRGVTGPMNFKNSGGFIRKIVLPGFWGHWLPSKHFN